MNVYLMSVIIIVIMTANADPNCGYVYVDKSPRKTSDFTLFVLVSTYHKSSNGTSILDFEKYIFSYAMLYYSTLSYFNHSRYKKVEICESREILLRVLMNLITHHDNLSTVLLTSYISCELTELAASILVGTEFHYVGYCNGNMYTYKLAEYNNIIIKYGYDLNTQSLLEKYKELDVTNYRVYQFCEERLHCTNLSSQYIKSNFICLKLRHIHGTITNENLKEIYKETWDTNVAFNIVEFRGSSSYNQINETLAYYFQNIEYFITTDIYTLFHQHCLRLLTKYKYFLNTTYCDQYQKFEMPLGLRKLYITISTILIHGWDHIVDKRDDIDKQARQVNASCIVKHCEKGKEPIFDNISDPYENWTMNYGWYCRRCSSNSIKSFSGAHRCTACPKDFYSNADNTACFDLYTTRHLLFKSSFGIVFSTMSFILLAFTTTVFVIFFKYRNTPIISASDKSFTFLQLASHMLLCISLPLLFFVPPTAKLCLMRSLICGMMLIIPSAICLTRMQKFLMIFNAKIHMDNREIRKTKTTYLSISIVVVLINVTIILAAMEKNDIKTSFIKLYKSRTKYIYCNNNSHIIYQLVFICVLYIVNTVQAFRARRLPSNFKETSSTLFASFACVMMLVSASLVYYSQYSRQDKDMILMFVIFLLNTIHAIFLSFYKLYIVILRPEMNTVKEMRKLLKIRLDKNMDKTLEKHSVEKRTISVEETLLSSSESTTVTYSL